ncbi:MAG: VCBS repeat-containing protein [Phycisphaerae bacterium]|nr:VCBS repeat-containing protein [Phycisphaerae bacterium]MCZ2398374.1 VCBS repeat-containing protein [Phycisphaerae bacterium]NUQ48848.1 VCBS repeat-containing protein [Phycisphaerae bacterium]
MVARTAFGVGLACAVLASPTGTLPPAWADEGVIALPIQFTEQQASRFPQPPPNEYTNQLALADIDGDGDLDIAFANGGNYSTPGQPQKLRLFVNNGVGVFSDESDARTGGLTALARDVEFGDVDGDGDLDMAVATDFSTLPRLLINNGAGYFSDESATRLPGIPLGSAHCAFGDVDNDGDLDLMFANALPNRFGNGQTQLYLNDGAGHFTDATAMRMPAQLINQPMDAFFADLDGDLSLDIVVVSRGTNGTRLYRNDGHGFFAAFPGSFPPNAGSYAFDPGDVDGDGDLDMLAINAAPSSLVELVLQNDGLGGFTDATNTILPPASNPAVDDNDSRWFDMDNDGDLDLLIGSLGNSERICRNTGGVLTLTTGAITAIADSTLDIEVGDLDGDGDLDIVTGQGESGSYVNRIYINIGAPDTLPPRIIRFDQLSGSADAGPYVVRACIRDDMTTDTNFFPRAIELRWQLDGAPQPNLRMTWMGGDLYRAAIPGQPCGTRIVYEVAATDFAGNTGVGPAHAFSAGLGPADLNTDGAVDQADLGILLNAYGQSAEGDIDGDGDTDQADLGALLTRFGQECP